MGEVTTIGLDLAQNKFPVHGVDAPFVRHRMMLDRRGVGSENEEYITDAYGAGLQNAVYHSVRRTVCHRQGG